MKFFGNMVLNWSMTDAGGIFEDMPVLMLKEGCVMEDTYLSIVVN
jgi:hypothetical protein